MKSIKYCCIFFLLFACNFQWNDAVEPVATGKFWHVTDFHWDLNYTEFGGDLSNYCWDGNNTGKDIGHFGNYACDSPWSLVMSTLNFMKAKLPNPDFIVWTGDDDAHVPDTHFSHEKVLNIMANLTYAIQSVFPNVTVIPVFGNHDAFPKSNFAPEPGNELYVDVADLWRDWLGEDAYITFQKGGYFMVPHPVLTDAFILGLNTPVYYNKNKLVVEDIDPLGQLRWLNATLAGFAANNQKAYIVAHIPPGMFGRKVLSEGQKWFRDRFNQIYLDIVVKYSNSIYGQFYGHDHTDSFKLYYDMLGTPVNVHFASPAVTPWNTTLGGIGPNNPSARLFEYDTSTGEIINYEQYYLNLSAANLNGSDNWELEYDFLSAYDLPDLSANSINTMAQTFWSPDRTYFDKYYWYNSVSYSPASECDDVCRRNHYCGIVKVDYSDFVDCNNNYNPPSGLGEDYNQPFLITQFNKMLNEKWNFLRNFPAFNQLPNNNNNNRWPWTIQRYPQWPNENDGDSDI